MQLKKNQIIQNDLKKLFEQVNAKDLSALIGSHIFITGVSGFTGLWVCHLIDFLNKNYNFNTRISGWDRDLIQLKNYAPDFLNVEHFKFSQGDVSNISELPKDVDYVLHLAGSPDSNIHASQPIEVMKSLSVGTLQLLTAADRLSNLKMFVNLSSALVYGSTIGRHSSLSESEPLSQLAQTPYVAGKLFSEQITQSFRLQLRLPSIILRPFTFIGPFQKLNSPWAINNFIQDALNGNSIKVLGSGNSVRSFMYGSDAAYWILFLMTNSEAGQVYNLGSSHPVLLSEAAKIVSEQFEKAKEIQFCVGQSSSNKDSYLVPDTSKVEKLFKLKTTKNIEQAIKSSVEWYMGN